MSTGKPCIVTTSFLLFKCILACSHIRFTKKSSLAYSSFHAYLSFSSFLLFVHIEHASKARKKDRICFFKLALAIFILHTSFLNSYSILFLMAFLPFIFVFLFIITSFSALLYLTFFALQIKSIFFRLLLSLSLSLSYSFKGFTYFIIFHLSFSFLVFFT